MRTPLTLARLALAGEAGRPWYRDAMPGLVATAADLSTSVPYLCAVLAATSPRVHVRRNIKMAKLYLRFGVTSGMLPIARGALAKLPEDRMCVDLDALTAGLGPKTGPFARALAGDPDALVLDVWMARALDVEQKALDRKGTRAKAVKRVRKTARDLGWPVAETQAAIWTAAYDNHYVAGTPPAFDLGI
jgi:hypothetical protein